MNGAKPAAEQERQQIAGEEVQTMTIDEIIAAIKLLGRKKG